MEAFIQRAHLLIERQMFDQAERELRHGLGNDPNNGYAHSLLALCLTARKQFAEATEEVHQAIGLDPAEPFHHFVHANVLNDRNRFGEALESIDEAIRLNPVFAPFHALKASIHLNLKQWQPALDAAQAGLQFDPEHTGCRNFQASALRQLGRHDEASQAIADSLAKDPDNSWTHANHGWQLLENGDSKEALHHFSEALRLEPDNGWARTGLITALKAQHLFYRIPLAYFLWIGKLSSRAQWGFVLGLYIAFRIAGSVADQHPGLAPFVEPLIFLYLGFVLTSWFADPLFNLLLRLHPVGKHALTPRQRWCSNIIGPILLLAAAISVVGVFLGLPLWGIGLQLAIPCMPISSYFRTSEGWPRTVMGVVTIGFLALLLGSVGGLVVALSLESVPAWFEQAILYCGRTYYRVMLPVVLASVFLPTLHPKR